MGELRQGLQVRYPVVAALLPGRISCPGSVLDVDLGKAGGLFPEVLCPGRVSAEHPRGTARGWAGGRHGAHPGDGGGGRSLSLPPTVGLSFLLTVSPGCSIPLLGRNGPSCQKIP